MYVFLAQNKELREVARTALRTKGSSIGKYSIFSEHSSFDRLLQNTGSDDIAAVVVLALPDHEGASFLRDAMRTLLQEENRVRVSLASLYRLDAKYLSSSIESAIDRSEEDSLRDISYFLKNFLSESFNPHNEEEETLRTAEILYEIIRNRDIKFRSSLHKKKIIAPTSHGDFSTLIDSKYADSLMALPSLGTMRELKIHHIRDHYVKKSAPWFSLSDILLMMPSRFSNTVGYDFSVGALRTLYYEGCLTYPWVEKKRKISFSEIYEIFPFLEQCDDSGAREKSNLFLRHSGEKSIYMDSRDYFLPLSVVCDLEEGKSHIKSTPYSQQFIETFIKILTEGIKESVFGPSRKHSLEILASVPDDENPDVFRLSYDNTEACHLREGDIVNITKDISIVPLFQRGSNPFKMSEMLAVWLKHGIGDVRYFSPAFSLLFSLGKIKVSGVHEEVRTIKEKRGDRGWN